LDTEEQRRHPAGYIPWADGVDQFGASADFAAFLHTEEFYAAGDSDIAIENAVRARRLAEAIWSRLGDCDGLL
jgi:hypothetical protein